MRLRPETIAITLTMVRDVLPIPLGATVAERYFLA